MKLRLSIIAFSLLFIISFESIAVRDIAYIIPDIAAPDMNVYMEIIVPAPITGNILGLINGIVSIPEIWKSNLLYADIIDEIAAEMGEVLE